MTRSVFNLKNLKKNDTQLIMLFNSCEFRQTIISFRPAYKINNFSRIKEFLIS